MKIQDALAFQRLYQRLKDEVIDLKVAYKLNKLNNKVSEEVRFYEESIQKILKQYAQFDEGGNFKISSNGEGVLIQPEHLENCQKKINELQNIEFSVLDLNFTFEELENLKITPFELSCLTELITE